MERSQEEARNLLEREWLDQRLAGNPHWFKYRNTQRDYACANKKFVIWECIEGQPLIIDVLKVGAIGISWSEGFNLVLDSQKSQSQYTVTARPSEMGLGVFIWIPAFADSRFAPMQYTEPTSTPRLTLPILFRSMHSPGRHIEGARYVSSMKDFKAAWPGIF